MQTTNDTRTLSQLLVDGLLTERTPEPQAPLFKTGSHELSRAEQRALLLGVQTHAAFRLALTAGK